MFNTQTQPHTLKDPKQATLFRVAIALDATSHSKTVVDNLYLYCDPAKIHCDLTYVAPQYVDPDRRFETLDDEAQQETVRIVNDAFDGYADSLQKHGFKNIERHFICDVPSIEEGLLQTLGKNHGTEPHPDLLILGMHDGQPQRKGWRIHSTSYAIATHTSIPVMVIKQPPHQKNRLKVLFATDGSDHSWHALDQLFAILPKETSVLSLLTVVSINTYVLPVVEPYIDYHALENALAGQAAQLLEKTQSLCEQAGYKISGSSFVLGDPAKEILEEAQEDQADLIVLGSHGVGGQMADWLLGSVSSKVLEYSTASVALLR